MQPRGSIAFIDPRIGKNDPKAITNLEHPEEPTFDKGDSCEPWPLSERLVVFSGRPAEQKRNQLEMMDRDGHRLVLMSDPGICLHSPMLVKPRPVPKAMADATDRRQKTGRFFVQDVYKGLTGVHGFRNGDQHVRANVEVPPRLNGDQRDALRKFAEFCTDAHHPQHRKFLDAAEEFYAHKKAMEEGKKG